jgi:hypothetical protein
MLYHQDEIGQAVEYNKIDGLGVHGKTPSLDDKVLKSNQQDFNYVTRSRVIDLIDTMFDVDRLLQC